MVVDSENRREMICRVTIASRQVYQVVKFRIPFSVGYVLLRQRQNRVCKMPSSRCAKDARPRPWSLDLARSGGRGGFGRKLNRNSRQQIQSCSHDIVRPCPLKQVSLESLTTTRLAYICTKPALLLVRSIRPHSYSTLSPISFPK
jgi:hypothetical protein